VHPDRLVQLRPDPQRGIKRRGRILGHVSDASAPHVPQLCGGQAQQAGRGARKVRLSLRSGAASAPKDAPQWRKELKLEALDGSVLESLLVLDAVLGLTSITQARAFNDAVPITGLVLAKLDGTAKGGALAAIATQRPVPVRFIGVGEKADDLRPFVASEFVEALFS